MDEREPQGEEWVGQMIGLAGPRHDLTGEDADRITAAAREVWRRDLQRRRLGRGVVAALAAAAAVLLFTVGLPLFRATNVPAPVQVASIETLTGELFVETDGQWHPAAVGDVLAAGAHVRTSSLGRGALRLDDGTPEGASVRLDRATHLTLEAADRLLLAAGNVYVSSSQDTPGPGLAVFTPFGVARDIGTQFQVRLEPSTVRVGVRNGLVLVERDGEEHRVEAGKELRVDETGDVTQSDLAPHGDSWSWLLELAPPFELEGSSVESYLDWVVSETGWTIRYASAEAAERARRAVLHGRLEAVDPTTAELVLLSAGLASRFEEGELVVE